MSSTTSSLDDDAAAEALRQAEAEEEEQLALAMALLNNDAAASQPTKPAAAAFSSSSPLPTIRSPATQMNEEERKGSSNNRSDVDTNRSESENLAAAPPTTSITITSTFESLNTSVFEVDSSIVTNPSTVTSPGPPSASSPLIAPITSTAAGTKPRIDRKMKAFTSGAGIQDIDALIMPSSDEEEEEKARRRASREKKAAEASAVKKAAIKSVTTMIEAKSQAVTSSSTSATPKRILHSAAASPARERSATPKRTGGSTKKPLAPIPPTSTPSHATQRSRSVTVVQKVTRTRPSSGVPTSTHQASSSSSSSSSSPSAIPKQQRIEIREPTSETKSPEHEEPRSGSKSEPVERARSLSRESERKRDRVSKPGSAVHARRHFLSPPSPSTARRHSPSQRHHSPSSDRGCSPSSPQHSRSPSHSQVRRRESESSSSDHLKHRRHESDSSSLRHRSSPSSAPVAASNTVVNNSNAALEARLHELEQHIRDSSLLASFSHNPNPLGEPQLGILSDRSSINQLKMRILELEKDSLVLQSKHELTLRELQEAKQAEQAKALEHQREQKAAEDRFNQMRTQLSSQVSELEQTNYELKQDINQMKASSIDHNASYRELIAIGGSLVEATEEKAASGSTLASPSKPAAAASISTTAISTAELLRIQAELKSTDLLLTELNKDNIKLHNELKLAEAKYKYQLSHALEENKKLKFDAKNKQDEIVRLTNLHENLLDPTARHTIQDLHVKMQQEREKHQQEKVEMKYEFDKLRASMHVEKEIKRDAVENNTKESLRMTLETLQAKYAQLQQQRQSEVHDLQTKLVWYIENQELLTTLQADLSKAKQEITKLRDENILMTHLLPVGTKLDDATARVVEVKSKPQDVKRIKELEAIVKEMREFVKKKNASLFGGGSGENSRRGSSRHTSSAANPLSEEVDQLNTLRAQLREVSNALKQKENDAAIQVRSMQQEIDQQQLTHEARIVKLQNDLKEAQKKIPLQGRAKTNRVTELERLLDEQKKFYQEKLKKHVRFVQKLKRGDTFDAASEDGAADAEEMKEMMEDAGEHPSNAVSTTKGEEAQESKESTPPISHDSIQLPGSRAPFSQTLSSTLDSDHPRSPLRAQQQPHPHPLAPMDQSTRDFLIFKQTLHESHDRDLHALTTRYEAQLEQAKLQWDSQIQVIRATHDADMKLSSSLLQQAQDEVTRIRLALQNEMKQRSLMQDRCLQLESDLQSAKNSPAYCNYKELEHKIDSMASAWEQREREYAAVSAKSLAEAKHERAKMDAIVRQKNDQLTSAQARFQQLTHALRQMQEQLNAQRATMQQQQQQQQQHQQRPSTLAPPPRTPLASLSMNAPPPAHQSATAKSRNFLQHSDMVQFPPDAFTTEVHEAEDLLNPSLTAPSLVNSENLEISWNFLMAQK